MQDDLLDVLIGCGCKKRCCCGAGQKKEEEAPTPGGFSPQSRRNNLFQAAPRTSTRPPQEEESPFIPPTRYARRLATPLPNSVPSLGVEHDRLTAEVRYTDGWQMRAFGLPESLQNSNAFRQAGHSAVIKDGDTLYGLSTSLYSAPGIHLYRQGPGEAPTLVGSWPYQGGTRMEGDVEVIENPVDAYVAVQGGTFVVYQPSYRVTQRHHPYVSPTQPGWTETLSREAGLWLHHITPDGGHTLGQEGWGAVPEGWQGVRAVGNASNSHVSIWLHDRWVTAAPGADALTMEYGGAWVTTLDEDVPSTLRPPVRAAGEDLTPHYSLSATARERRRLKGDMTLLVLDTLPAGLLNGWPIAGWPLPDQPGVLAHTPALIVHDPDRVAWEAYPPETAVLWRDEDRLKPNVSGPAYHFRVNELRADNPPPFGTLQVLSRPVWAMPGALAGSEAFPVALEVSAGELGGTAEALTVPTLTDRLASRVTWRVPAGTHTLTATFPEPPADTRATAASVAVRGLGGEGCELLIGGRSPAADVTDLTRRTWLHETAQVNPGSRTLTLTVTTPRARALHLGQFSLLHTTQSIPL